VSVVFLQGQRILWACCDACASDLRVFGSDFASLQDRVARFVDRKQLRVNGIAPGVTAALGIIDADLHGCWPLSPPYGLAQSKN
jgi:hypothetical protein